MSDPTLSHILIEALSIATVTAISYVSTNFDNLVVLSAYGAKPGYKPLLVNLTFLLVCLIVLLASLALAQAADALPSEKIRYLGLIPIGVGCYHLVRLFTDRAGRNVSGRNEVPGQIGLSAYVGFALVLLANSSDSISVMTPVLADLKPVFVVVCFAASVAMAICMSALANILTRHPGSRHYLERLDKWVLPFLLIGIGMLILTNTPSDIFVA